MNNATVPTWQPSRSLWTDETPAANRVIFAIVVVGLAASLGLLLTLTLFQG